MNQWENDPRQASQMPPNFAENLNPLIKHYQRIFDSVSNQGLMGRSGSLFNENNNASVEGISKIPSMLATPSFGMVGLYQGVKKFTH